MSIPAYNLSEDNYYSPEADAQYMSASQYKAFMKCEAAALASIRGEWVEPTSDAMLVGSYVHSAVEGSLEHFKAAHPEILTQKGTLRAEYKQADKMIQTLLTDDMIVDYLQGFKEFIVTADLFGCRWKAKIDVYNPNTRNIVDVKTVRSLNQKEWSREDGRYLSWVEAYGYIRQLAIYTELVRQWTEEDTWHTPYIIAVTKEDVPDKAIIGMTAEDIALELSLVEVNMPRILAVKSGEAKPTRCEHCDYCKTTKKVNTIIHFRDIAI